MPHLDVPGASLYYEAHGHVSQPALLLIHAGIANLRMWDPQIPALTREHYVIRFDTRGFGQTRTENVEFSNRADALAVLDHLGVARATVIGCSRGGTIAIDLTVDSPDRVSGLVVIGSGPSGFPDTELTELEDARFDEIDQAFEAQDWQKLARLEAAIWDFGPLRREEDLDPAFVAIAYALNEANVVHATESPVSIPLEPPAYDRVVDIDVPTLVAVGEYDMSEVLAAYEYLLTTVPDADGCVIRDTAHLPNVERPDVVETVLLDWLRDHGL
jgi:pimeloyl-ACP methyl ester carboxylesterase